MLYTNNMKTIDLIMGSDHRGLEMKHKLLDFISPDDINGETKFNVAVIQNLKPHEPGVSVDYPDVVQQFGKSFDIYSHGILVCGSGYGVSIAANRFKDIRAVVCRTPREAEMARRHNNANVLCLGADFTTMSQAKKIVKAFFTTDFEGGRHQRRVKKLGKL
jgi:ribose 5-phosphate isomerase B